MLAPMLHKGWTKVKIVLIWSDTNLSPDHMKDVSHKYGSTMHLQNSNFKIWLEHWSHEKVSHQHCFFYAPSNCQLLKITLYNNHMKMSSTVWFLYASPNCHLPKINLNLDHIKYLSCQSEFFNLFKVLPFKKSLSTDHMKIFYL